ncbi:MAG: hypothetical protein COT74_04140 [Bdellovibrionales bacterium CG10_big_fil_rev_8_21_14_0_10_45_34]|nr:MAG: hypothetical protein COT74_04140 [Bdellovibrionales bacterium CG10_big_fil_rev_8_21_14_0_10_45_34]
MKYFRNSANSHDVNGSRAKGLRFPLSAAFLYLAMTLIGTIALAASGEATGPGIMLLFQLINLLLLFGLIYFFANKKIKKHLSDRYAKFISQRDAAKTKLADAKNRLSIAESRLKNVETTSQKAISEAQVDSTKMFEKMVSEAKASTDKLLVDVEKQGQQLVSQALLKLKDGAIESAIFTSEKRLREVIRSEDQDRLHREFVEKIVDTVRVN